MSTKPPATTGRVKSMRNRFENLNSLEHFEALTINLSKTEVINPVKTFRRSATSFDLIVPKKLGNLNCNNNNNNNHRRPTTIATATDNATLDDVRQHLNHVKETNGNNKSTESNSFKSLNGCNIKNTTSKPPLTEITENVSHISVHSRLSRHTSDPVKRGSIKRSPAFRVGDKHSSTSRPKILSPANAGVTQPVPTDDLSERIESLLKRTVDQSKIIYQPGITDTLKAALKQPLPTGPPPKKPPRAFLDSPSPKEELSTISMFESTVVTASETTSIPVINNKLKSKIKLLQNNLQLKTCIESRPPLSPPHTSNTIFGCIPSCTATAVYDSVRIYSDEDDITAKPDNPAEHIYMEPYGHLKVVSESVGDSGNGIKSTDAISSRYHRNNSQISESSMDSFASGSGCACPEEHTAENEDLHYLCTSIDNSIRSETETTSADSDQPHSLTNTYDEINILVNAAFNDKLMGSRAVEMTASGIDKNDRSLGADQSSPVLLRNATIKLSRSLTEKRKDYVQRISARNSNNATAATYGTLHRTFKSPVITTFSVQNDSSESDNDVNLSSTSTSERINKYKQLIETTNASIVSTSRNLLTERKAYKNESQHNCSILAAHSEDNSKSSKLMFEMCMLVGFNNSTSKAYIKSRFPPDREAPQNVEQLVFPSSFLVHQSRSDCQEYSLILTDDQGNHIYGYCRRVLPESCEICLPLAYCLISQTKAPGFFFKILKEIEQRHGQTDVQSNNLLTMLQSRPIPEPGRFLHIRLPSSPQRAGQKLFMSNHKISAKRLSLEINPKWLTESAAQAAFPESTESTLEKNSKKSGLKSLVQEFEDKKQQDREAPFDLSLINRSLLTRAGSAQRASAIDEILIKRPNDLRLESTELCDVYLSLGAELLCNVFGSLLLERKVILFSENISRLSSCILGLQTILYPFQWQYTLVTLLPQSLSEICQAPVPVLAGLLEPIQCNDAGAIEDGILVNLDTKQVQHKCGDESTILPAQLRQSLLVSLEMVDILDQGKMLSSVLIAEAFLRFFVELFAGLKNSKIFKKEEFVHAHPSQSVRLFLEWFVETAMFRHFQNVKFPVDESPIGDATAYALFDARLLEKSEGKKSNQNLETIMKNCKIINKKAKTFKDRFRDFLK